jgi:hypothetical protein
MLFERQSAAGDLFLDHLFNWLGQVCACIELCSCCMYSGVCVDFVLFNLGVCVCSAGSNFPIDHFANGQLTPMAETNNGAAFQW